MEKEQIDACVILELVMEQRNNKDQRRIMEKCRGYLRSHVARYQNAVISLPALGEVFGVLLTKVPDFNKRQEALGEICTLVDQCSIKISSPKKETYKITQEIMEFDTRMEPADALRIAEAVTGQAIFITLDRNVRNFPLVYALVMKVSEHAQKPPASCHQPIATEESDDWWFLTVD